MISLDDFVEAHITNLQFLEDKRLIELTFILVKGRKAVLKIVGADRFVANELRETNIVDQIQVWDQKSELDSFKEDLTELVTGDQDHLKNALEHVIQKELLSIKSGEKVFIVIEPVCGARILALANSFSLDQ